MESLLPCHPEFRWCPGKMSKGFKPRCKSRNGSAQDQTIDHLAFAFNRVAQNKRSSGRQLERFILAIPLPWSQNPLIF